MKKGCRHFILLIVFIAVAVLVYVKTRPSTVTVSQTQSSTSASSTSKSSSSSATITGHIAARSALAVEVQSGKIIYEQNADQVLPIASLTKLITYGVIRQKIDQGKLSWQKKVSISTNLARFSQNQAYSNVALVAGSTYTVRQLTNASLIQSADAATIALARSSAKNDQAFIAQMKQFTKSLGIQDARLYNCVGLENSDMAEFGNSQLPAAAENAMTAKDLAIIARALLLSDPDILKVTSQKSPPFSNTSGQTTNLQTYNKMLPGMPYALSTITIDGLKTGTTNNAGACFVSTGIVNHKRIITVVLHADGGGEQRFIATQELYKLIQQHEG